MENSTLKQSLKLSAFFILLTFSKAFSQQNEVEKATGKFIESLINPVESELKTLLHDGLTYGHSSGKVEDKPSLIQSLNDKTSDFVTIEVSNQTVQIFKKTAIVRHRIDCTTNNRGIAGTVSLLVMLVWELNHKSWKLIGRQAVKVTN